MTNLAQIQTNAQLHFTKPFILVTRVGENSTNDAYHNPHQKYYEFDTMKSLFFFAKNGFVSKEEKPVSALRVRIDNEVLIDGSVDMQGRQPSSGRYRKTVADYFHNFTAALDEYKRGIRVDM